MKVLVTGSSGHLGEALVRTLTELGHEVAGFDITAENPEANTMTFAGYGWSGSFTAHDQVSAVLLRPS